jgi:hypothetical protein
MEKGHRPGRRTGSSRATTAGADETRLHARAIERFHLAFMQVAATQLRPEDSAVKGGGNLRFFLRSGRRSADLDLDYRGRDFDNFGDRVNAIFTGTALPRLLKLRDIQLVEPRLRKNTATTKRWMFKLTRPGMPDATSKVEFSNRGAEEEVVVDQVDPALATKLGGIAPRLQHYPPPAAVAQKVGALCDRSTTEPRDVFDLDHLIRQYPGALGGAQLQRERLMTAAKIAEDLPYEPYQDLVEPYLDEDIVSLYSGEQAWLGMQIRVVTRLRERAAE